MKVQKNKKKSQIMKKKIPYKNINYYSKIQRKKNRRKEIKIWKWKSHGVWGPRTERKSWSKRKLMKVIELLSIANINTNESEFVTVHVVLRNLTPCLTLLQRENKNKHFSDRNQTCYLLSKDIKINKRKKRKISKF